nr:uncharacterized protein LOC109400437 [Aedes albopictus]
MQLRSGKLKKVLFLSPVVSPLSSSAVFSTPTSALGEVVSTPLRSVREQKEEQAARQRNAAMAESVAALEQCLESTKGKVDRIRQAIVAADHDYGKFNIHALKLYVRTVDAANDEYSGFLNRIYLVDPTMRNQFEPRYIDFEELYHFVRISLSEMIQQYEDDQKDAAEVAIAETLKQEKANSNSQLDAETRRAWEATVEHGKLPEYRKTMDFLREYCYMLERCEQPVGPPKSKNSTQTPRASAASSKVHTATVPSTNTCLLCNGDHLIGLCETFKGLSVNNRYSKAKQLGLCFACLKRGHRTANCKLDSSKLCECKKKHHPLMHFELKKESSEVATGNAETRKVAEGSGASIGEPQTVAKCEIQREPTTLVKQVLLATAEVDVLDSSGVAHKCRALLDSGAMASFVSERMCDLLSLRKRYVNVPVVGVTGAKTTVKFKATAMVKSRTTDYSFSLDCLVVPRVTGALPSLKVDAAGWPIPRDLKLADPKFCDPSRVDMLVGAEKFYELLQSRKIRLAGDLPQLQESLLGWLVAGPVYNTQNVVSVQATYTRGNDGRYIVQLPFREDAGQLGDSRAQAEQRFKALEKRLDKSPELKQMYSRFIHEYLELGHIKTVRETLGIDLSRVVLRSDSKIVICWIKRPKPNLPVFVRNRIAEIRKITDDTEWFHVGTTENPADLVSRGVLPTELLKSDLWWNGPDFLRSSVDESTDEIVDMNEPPVAFEAMTVVTASYDSLYTAIQNSSNFRRLQRVFGYVTRFVRNCRAKKNKEEPRRGNLTVADHRDSLYAMVRIVQHAVYREEISCILKGENVRASSIKSTD